MATASPAPSVASNQFIDRSRLKRPIDKWSTREKLCLSSAVYKIGDQNWVSVSRAVKPYAEPNRSSEWAHQKNCVLQYYDMLEQLEQPKRKRGDKGETDTPSLQIMRKMTIERSEQLKMEINEMQEEFKRLKDEAEAIESGEWDDRLEEEWEKIQEEERLTEMEIKVEPVDSVEDPQGTGDNSVVGIVGDLDDSTQDSISGNVDVCKIVDEDGTVGTSALTLDASGKLAASSHLLSSLLQSNVKSTNELQQLKREREQVTTTVPSTSSSAPHLSSPNQISLLKSSASHGTLSSQSHSTDVSIPITSSSSTAVSSEDIKTLPANVGGTTVVESSTSCSVLEEGSVEIEEDGMVDVTTDLVEETVLEHQAQVVCVGGQEDVSLSSTCGPVMESIEVVEEEVIGMEEDEKKKRKKNVEEEVGSIGITKRISEMKKEEEEEDKKKRGALEEEEEVTVDEELDLKETTAELDVEGLEEILAVKEEVDKDSQDEDELATLKHLSESIITSGTEVELMTEASLKNEPMSPTSSISSRISETGSKRGRRGKAKSVRSRMSSRKSNTRKNSCFCCKQDDERNKEDGNSSRFSDADLSEEDIRDTDDILSGGLGASTTGSLMSESFPNSPASLSICSDTEEEKSYKQWKKSIMLVWRAAATHKYANVFLHPVTDDIAPGYKTVVLRPMDLSTIKKNVESGAIRHTTEFQRDLMLMFSNAIMYNSTDHNVNRMATEMYDDVMLHIEQYVNTQIMMQTTDAKSLRQSRRPDISDKEEEGNKKRRLSVDQSAETGGKTKKRKTRLDET